MSCHCTLSLIFLQAYKNEINLLHVTILFWQILLHLKILIDACSQFQPIDPCNVIIILSLHFKVRYQIVQILSAPRFWHYIIQLPQQLSNSGVKFWLPKLHPHFKFLRIPEYPEKTYQGQVHLIGKTKFTTTSCGSIALKQSRDIL